MTLKRQKRNSKQSRICARLLPLNNPVALIPLGLVLSTIGGCIFPLFGIFWCKMLFVMQPNLNEPDSRIDMSGVRKYTFIMLGLAVASLIFIFLNRALFGVLGESMTKHI